MKTNTLFQVRFRPSVKPPRGFTKSAHYNVTAQTDPFIGKNEYLIGNTWLPASYFIKIEIEDAPVFNKPPLRKIASLKPDEVIECNTEAELKAVLEQAEREGLEWFNKKRPTENIPTDPTPLYVYTTNDKRLAYFAKKLSSFTILPASKFVEVAAEGKPEQVEKPEQFKVGDWVRSLGGCEFEQGMYIETDAYGMAIIENADWYKIVVPHHTLRKIDRPIESYKPFPNDYEIPENTRIVVIESHLYSGENSTYIKAGETGVTIDKSTCPDVKFDSGILHHNGKSYLDILSHNLAPLDDRDHPEHPEFGKKKQKETITQAQKDECRKLQERIKELEALCELRQQDIDNFADDLSDCNELINRMKELAKCSLSVNNDMLNRAALRSIANGEI